MLTTIGTRIQVLFGAISLQGQWKIRIQASFWRKTCNPHFSDSCACEATRNVTWKWAKCVSEGAQPSITDGGKKTEKPYSCVPLRHTQWEANLKHYYFKKISFIRQTNQRQYSITLDKLLLFFKAWQNNRTGVSFLTDVLYWNYWRLSLIHIWRCRRRR